LFTSQWDTDLVYYSAHQKIRQAGETQETTVKIFGKCNGT